MPDLMIPTRRRILGGLGLAVAAPAIVRASSLMPVKSMPASIPKPFTIDFLLRVGVLTPNEVRKLEGMLLIKDMNFYA